MTAGKKRKRLGDREREKHSAICFLRLEADNDDESKLSSTLKRAVDSSFDELRKTCRIYLNGRA